MSSRVWIAIGLCVLLVGTFAGKGDATDTLPLTDSSGTIGLKVPAKIDLGFIGDHVKGKIGPGRMTMTLAPRAGRSDMLDAVVEISAKTKLMFQCEKRVPMIATLDGERLMKLAMAPAAPESACRLSFKKFDPIAKTGRYSLYDKPGDILPAK